MLWPCDFGDRSHVDFVSSTLVMARSKIRSGDIVICNSWSVDSFTRIPFCRNAFWLPSEVRRRDDGIHGTIKQEYHYHVKRIYSKNENHYFYRAK